MDTSVANCDQWTRQKTSLASDYTRLRAAEATVIEGVDEVKRKAPVTITSDDGKITKLHDAVYNQRTKTFDADSATVTDAQPAEPVPVR